MSRLIHPPKVEPVTTILQLLLRGIPLSVGHHNTIGSPPHPYPVFCGNLGDSDVFCRPNWCFIISGLPRSQWNIFLVSLHLSDSSAPPTRDRPFKYHISALSPRPPVFFYVPVLCLPSEFPRIVDCMLPHSASPLPSTSYTPPPTHVSNDWVEHELLLWNNPQSRTNRITACCRKSMKP